MQGCCNVQELLDAGFSFFSNQTNKRLVKSVKQFTYKHGGPKEWGKREGRGGL